MDNSVVILILALAVYYRFSDLPQPPSVLWDEAHFNRFSNAYSRRLYFFDVHPPLGKLTNYVWQWIGNSSFKEAYAIAGAQYEGHDHAYIYTRSWSAFSGSLLVLCSFFTVKSSNQSIIGASIASLLLAFDSAFIMISRLAISDSQCICLTAIYCLLHVRNRSGLQLILNSLILGLLISSKLNGLFVLVGVVAFETLQILLNLPILPKISSLIVKLISIVVLPSAVYLMTFYVHFSLTNHSSSEADHLSPRYQASLANNRLRNEALVKYVCNNESTIVLKEHRPFGLYLSASYFLDDDQEHHEIIGTRSPERTSFWLLEYAGQSQSQFTLRNGRTKKYLATRQPDHSSEETQVILTNSNQGRESTWLLEQISGDKYNIQTWKSQFSLKNHKANCHLAFRENANCAKDEEQEECDYSSVCLTDKSKAALFIIYSNTVSKTDKVELIDTSEKEYGFWAKLTETHYMMFHASHLMLNTEHSQSSKPWQWIFNQKPIQLQSEENADDLNSKHQFLSISMSDVTWMSNLTSLAFCSLFSISMFMPFRERIFPSTNMRLTFLLILWTFNYFPYFLMHQNRVLFLHHYLPAAYLNCLITGVLIDNLKAYVFGLRG